MDLEWLREKFRGRDFWRNTNRIIGWGAYSIFLVSAFVMPQNIWWLLMGYVIILPGYGYYYKSRMLEQEKARKGNKVIEGWITHAYGKGERIYLTPVKIELEDKLSDENLEKIKDYVVLLDQQAKATKVETGISKFKPKLLTVQEIAKKEIKDKTEMLEKKEEEKAELKKAEEEYREKKALTLQNNNNLIIDKEEVENNLITDEEELEDE